MRVFRKYDTDKSGQLDIAEFSDLTYSLGYYMNPTEIKKAVEIIDKDRSGQISYEEVISFLKRPNN